MDYLDVLNPPQKEAVLHTDGPMMIIAGAGSGKTRVLTYRIANLIGNGVDAFNILALTFTNKAAKEMRNRIEQVVGGEAKNLWMGTFHAVFARILRVEAEKLGYPSNFTIYDTEDAKSLLKTIIKELKLDDKIYKPSSILGRISSAKNRLIGPQAYNNDAILMADDAMAMRPHTGKIYLKYAERCFKAGAMDFDDLLYNTNVLFKNHLDVLNKYQNRFHYVMVDEFQDTNLSQYLITRKLAAQRENICVVGDDAQSIYAFRGANIQNILNFENDYPNLKVIKLEQNYRSTQNIVKSANSIIEKNKEQLRKAVWTANNDGELVEVLKAGSDNEEGRMVANAIFEQKMQDKYRYKDFAILYRTNSQSRAFEEALRKLNIKYKIVGGLSFYQRKEIKDLLAYLRFTINHNDEEALKRIINYPRRGIGDTTIEKIIILADENGVSLWDVISKYNLIKGIKATDALESFYTLIKSFEIAIKTKDAFDAASFIAKQSGILKELYEDKTIEGLARYENIQELLNAIKEFVDSAEKEDKSLGAFLQEVSLLTDLEKDSDGEEDAITLMTIHSSKGLEFKSVFVVGLEEDLFPSQMMLSSREDLEEERRLFYVAITRAEHRLTLSFAKTRYKFGKIINCAPSRFLEEIDTRYLKISTRKTALDDFTGVVRKESAPLQRKTIIAKPPAPVVTHQASPDFKPSNLSQLKAGMKVEHPKFGFGTVKMVDISGSDKKAVIQFEQAGEKTLLLGFAKLMIL